MRKNWIKKAGAAVLGLILTGSLLAGCGSGSAQTAQGADEPQAQETETAENESAGYRTLEEIQASGKVTIGVFSDKSPFGYVDENGEYQGYDVYFGNRIAQDLALARELLDSALYCRNGDDGLTEIILDCAQEYFFGELSAREAADLAQRRATLYIGERR